MITAFINDLRIAAFRWPSTLLYLTNLTYCETNNAKKMKKKTLNYLIYLQQVPVHHQNCKWKQSKLEITSRTFPFP